MPSLDYLGPVDELARDSLPEDVLSLDYLGPVDELARESHFQRMSRSSFTRYLLDSDSKSCRPNMLHIV